MKKLFAIIVAMMTTCCLMVAPAFAYEYETHEVPTVVTDTEADDGEHLIEAKAPDEQQAISAVANRVAEVDPDGKTQFGDWESGEILPVIEDKVVVDEQAWTEEIQHEAKTVTVNVLDSPAWTERIEHEGTDPVIETVSDGWAKCEKDGQEDYVFTGDKLIIHDGQSGYWFWSANEVPNWKDICANSGVNKANQAKEAQVGYGDFKYGNKVFTITANLIHANGGISWVAWEHLRQVVVEPGTPGWIEYIDHEAVFHQETAIIEPAWIEYINHPEVNHVEQVVVEPGYGWSSITYRLPEVPDVPVVPDDPDIPDPVIPDPDPDPTVTPVEEPEVVVDEPEVVVEKPEVVFDNPEVYVAQSQTPALPKTADKNDAVVILLAAVAVGAVAVLAYNARRYSKEK